MIERIGFRIIETRGTQILLNGEPIWLKGVCVHEDDLDFGKVSTEADIRRRFRDAKDLGCNFLRLSHYPHHGIVARIADRGGPAALGGGAGLLAIDFANSDTLADARNQLSELILRDINRASVIIWGVGNENADTDARLAFMADLARTAKRLDPVASRIGRMPHQPRRHSRSRSSVRAPRCHRHQRILRLVRARFLRPREAARQFRSGEARHHQRDRGLTPRLAIAARTCALHGGLAGRVLPPSRSARIAAAPYIAGLAAWLLYDFRTERRQTSFQRGFNRKGLIGADKATRKLAFDALAGSYRRM